MRPKHVFRLPEQVTTYGTEADPFVRMVERFRLDGNKLIVERSVLLRVAPERLVIAFPPVE